MKNVKQTVFIDEKRVLVMFYVLAHKSLMAKSERNLCVS